jgi:DNA mismatch repair protein MSH3
MPPKASSSSQPGQKTLSSFFTPRPSASSSNKREVEVLILDSSDSDGDTTSKSVKQLKKKVKVEHNEEGSQLQPIASTSRGNGASPPPPPPTRNGATSPVHIPPTASSSSSNALRSFAYAPPTSSSSSATPAALSTEQAKRREAFAKRLSVGGRKRSSYLEKGHYLAPGEEEGSDGSGKKKDFKGKGRATSDDEEDEGFDGGESESSEGGAGGGRFGKFAAKGASMAGGAVWEKGIQITDSSGKAVKYTPLESQVLALKKKYPDVLLVVEVRPFPLAFSSLFANFPVARAGRLQIPLFRYRCTRRLPLPQHRLFPLSTHPLRLHPHPPPRHPRPSTPERRSQSRRLPSTRNGGVKEGGGEQVCAVHESVDGALY